MKRTKTQKGITLIALIITIVVLLILTVVAIREVNGDGIIAKARRGATSYTKEQIKEQISLGFSENKIPEVMGNGKTMQEILVAVDGIDERNITKISEDLYYVTKDDIKLSVYSDGGIIEGFVSIWDGQTSEKPTIEDNNITISSAAQLKGYADMIVSGEVTAQTKAFLASSIDLNNKTISISTLDGIFDGQGNSILGLYSEQATFAGLFNTVNAGATLRNLTVSNSSINITGAGCSGSIVAKLKGTIENCHSINNNVECKDKTATVIGGVIGKGYEGSIIRNCTNSSTVNGGALLTGGIVGNMLGTSIKDCINTGNISSVGNNIGGISGQFGETGDMTNCINKGTVSTSGSYAGGIAGVIKGSIINCKNEGNIHADVNYAGGILGYGYQANTIIQNCTNTGAVSSNGNNKGDIYSALA